MFQPPSCSIALGLLPNLLGGIYLLAFLSLLAQVRGLFGSGGILPIKDYAALLKQVLDGGDLRRVPSLFLFDASDRFIVGCAVAGCLLSVLVICGMLQAPALLLLWMIYLSFVTMGQEFLSYQWDALLLESGFMTIFLPLADPAHPLVCLAYQIFIFRFLVSSGVVKLRSGDPNWRNLRALCFHYETQPIPNRLAWYAHQLPERLQKFSTLGTFFFELGCPFLFLGPAPARLAGFYSVMILQGLIMLTGNYGFFNLLTIVLALPLLDDRYLHAMDIGAGVQKAADPAAWLGAPAGWIFLIFILLNLMQLARLFVQPHWLSAVLARCGRWFISSPYGLFAVMTVERFEFSVEGSNDQVEWKEYEFRWKPGDPGQAPRQAAPHQPRLDWQMWFAALNPAVIEPWLRNLVARLLEGSPSVLALFGQVPFKSPPQWIRLVAYRYRFSDRRSRRKDGRWWQRERIGRSAAMRLGTRR